MVKDSNLRGETPLDHKSNALTTRPTTHLTVGHFFLYVGVVCYILYVQCKLSKIRKTRMDFSIFRGFFVTQIFQTFWITFFLSEFVRRQAPDQLVKNRQMRRFAYKKCNRKKQKFSIIFSQIAHFGGILRIALFGGCSRTVAACDTRSVWLAEWLRRWTQYPKGFPHEGSNPSPYVFIFKIFFVPFKFHIII